MTLHPTEVQADEVKDLADQLLQALHGSPHAVALAALAAALEEAGRHMVCCTAVASGLALRVGFRLACAAQGPIH